MKLYFADYYFFVKIKKKKRLNYMIPLETPIEKTLNILWINNVCIFGYAFEFFKFRFHVLYVCNRGINTCS